MSIIIRISSNANAPAQAPDLAKTTQVDANKTALSISPPVETARCATMSARWRPMKQAAAPDGNLRSVAHGCQIELGQAINHPQRADTKLPLERDGRQRRFINEADRPSRQLSFQ